MNISSIKNNSTTFAGASWYKRLFESLPDVTFNNGEKLSKIGTFINRPDVNRGIMGATAILTQPLIDYYNPKVDDDTATASACRTFGKVLAGTMVGCLVRSGCYYLLNACTSCKPNAKGWKQWLMPSQQMQQTLGKHNMEWFKNYKNSLSTIMGLGVMLITNVTCDVPLTNFFTKHLLNHFAKGGNGNSTTQSNPTCLEDFRQNSRRRFLAKRGGGL